MYTELMAAAYKQLITSVEIQQLVINGDLGSDDAEDQWADGWIFQGRADIVPLRNVEGTGTGAIVVRAVSSWSSNPHNTAEFPLLQVFCYADSTRDEEGQALARDGADRVERIAKTVDRVFHDPGNSKHLWPGLYVIACVRSAGISSLEVPETEQMVWRSEMRYEVSI